MDYYPDDDPWDGCMNQTDGGGGILYFPYKFGFNRRVKGEKFIVTYLLDEEFPTIVADAYRIWGNGKAKLIKLNGYTKRWAIKQFLKEKSNWVLDTL